MSNGPTEHMIQKRSLTATESTIDIIDKAAITPGLLLYQSKRRVLRGSGAFLNLLDDMTTCTQLENEQQ